MPDISKWFAMENLLHTSGGGIVGIFMMFAFIKGIAKQLLGMVCLALGFAGGYVAFRHAPEYLQRWFGVVHPNAVIITSIVAGGLVHQVTRRVLGGVLRPGMGEPQSGGGRVKSAGLSLIPACFLLWVLGMGIRWTGVLSQMKFLDEGLREDKKSLMETLPLFARLQQTLTNGWAGNVLNRTDPVASTEAGALCSLLLVQRDSDSWQRLHQDPACAAILRNPAVTRLVRDKDWTKPASFQNYAELLTLPEMSTALKDGALVEQLRKINVEQKIREATGTVPAA
jgi:hypothetical protein